MSESLRDAMSDDDLQLIAGVSGIPAEKVKVIVGLAEKRLHEWLKRRHRMSESLPDAIADARAAWNDAHFDNRQVAEPPVDYDNYVARAVESHLVSCPITDTQIDAAAEAIAERKQGRVSEPFTCNPDAEPGKDGTPGWAYDEDGYCVCCGNGRWKYHFPRCVLRDALDALEAARGKGEET